MENEKLPAETFALQQSDIQKTATATINANMYCRNCGTEISHNAIACSKCGANPRTEKNFCPSCGVSTNGNQVLCINCGASFVSQNSAAGSAANVQNNSKTVAIVAHLTIIGWIIALILNNQNKTEFGSYYVKQMLGLFIFTIEFFFIGLILLIFNFAVWLMSFINAINNRTKPMPVYGTMFQRWFKGM